MENNPEPEPAALEAEQPTIPYFSSLEVQAVYYEQKIKQELSIPEEDMKSFVN